MQQPDLNLVFLLSENARAKIKNIAAAVKKSPQRVKYTLSALQREGVLFHPYCIIDYSRFGFLLFRAYFKGGYAGEQEKVKIFHFLQHHPSVVSLYELSGEFDFVIEILVPNPSRFNKEVRKIAALFPTLNNYKIVLNVVTHIYPRWYLSQGKLLLTEEPVSMVVGGDRAWEAFDARELRLLQALREDPILRYTSLARKSQMNVKTAISLLKALHKRKVVRGFQYLIDLSHLGVFRFRLFLKFHNVSDEREDQLMQYLLNTPEIVQVNKTVGDWNMEIDLESRDQMRIRFLIREVREQFKDIIETFNLMEFYKTYFKSYLPRSWFEEEKKSMSGKGGSS